MDTYTIAIAVIQSSSKYLIAKRSAAKKFASDQWEFISGFVDITETAEQTILREIQEELHVEGNVVSRADKFSVIDSEGKWVVIPFLVRLSKPEIQINPSDHPAIKWVIAKELNGYPDLKPFLDNKGIQAFLNFNKK